jgi:hypothetical protein
MIVNFLLALLVWSTGLKAVKFTDSLENVLPRGNKWKYSYEGFLCNEMEGEMTGQYLDLAKHILARKFILGFEEDFEESMRRFSKSFNGDQEIGKEKLQK